jgi:hypothetical protein
MARIGIYKKTQQLETMKRNLYTTLLLFLLVNSLRMYAMEIDKPEVIQGSLEATFKTIKDNLPIELCFYILPYIDNLIKQDDGTYDLFIPSRITGQDSHEANLPLHDLTASINLNPCQIVCINNFYYEFSMRCLSKVDEFGFWNKCTNFTVENDETKEHFKGSIGFEARNSFFEGSNDAGYSIIAGNNIVWPTHRQKYQYIVGKLTKQRTEHSNKGTFETNPSYYELYPIDGVLTALALYKKYNRYALVDNKGIGILDLQEATEEKTTKNSSKRLCKKIRPELLGFCNLREGKKFKRICFITPTILFGVTERMGNLYRIDLNENEGKITIHKQSLKTTHDEKVTLYDIAVDPCYPHHILLHTRNNRLLYWNIKNHNRPENGKEFVSLLKDIEADKLWFYDNKICFGKLKGNQLCTKSYILYQLDLSIERRTKIKTSRKKKHHG